MSCSNIIAITNQKGGVGKTTTAVNLATALAAFGKKVLLIDFDPQGNSTTSFGIELGKKIPEMYKVMLGQELDITKAVLKTKITNLEIIPSNLHLAAIETEIVGEENKEFILKKHILNINVEYDFIIIDCPPSLNLLTINALVAANKIIIPMQCEFFALEGMAHLNHILSRIKQNLNPAVEIFGILLTMMDKRNRLCLQVAEDVKSIFREKVFNTVIPRNIKLSEAPSHGIPALIYDNRCSGSFAYIMLAKEILSNLGLLNDNYKSEEDGERKESTG